MFLLREQNDFLKFPTPSICSHNNQIYPECYYFIVFALLSICFY